ncbi:high frequency lysogenization protein HflD [Candidatus Parabeggiatoa sp. HSG14]|uniref:high frequency lysogenization protein HflD n=1 Tax=Candidatus Parabeggiatoa sp. HSG14 TaxID=3055593 RepID=UPI0025A79D1E|nr:high frequency lysogenization protein HflD [Thiotrichales bacterium HSG14]
MSIQNSTLALAGVFQSAELVRQIARQGLLDQAPFEASIQSVLKIDASSVEEVYGELDGVKKGLQVLCEQLGAGTKRNMEVMHYVLNLIFLERKLAKQANMMSNIQTGIVVAQAHTERYAVTAPEIITHLAEVYTETLSSFDYRIKVNGERRFLENQFNADKIRALLLAGVRSTVLWRQKGGKRLQFIFSRKKIVRFAQQYLENIKKSLV